VTSFPAVSTNGRRQVDHQTESEVNLREPGNSFCAIEESPDLREAKSLFGLLPDVGDLNPKPNGPPIHPFLNQHVID